MNKLIELKKSKKQTYLIEQYRKQQLTNAILYATKYDFEYITFKENILKDELINFMIKDMYGYSEPIIFLFKKDEGSEKIKIPNYQNLKRKIYMTNLLIDTRNVNEWFLIKKRTRYYSPYEKDMNLTWYIEKNYTTIKISQAWLKMYEMIVDLHLIKKNNNIFRTFHICEAPGNFIASINHYIKTMTNIKEFDWHAQSLKPEEKHDKRIAFGDDYGLISKYPKRWIWGEDNTGDITHINNIRFYEKYLNNCDLVTADCGLPNDFEESDNLLEVHFAEIVLILTGLDHEKNFLAKFMMPIVYPIQISIIYLLYQSFEKLIFYKGVINVFSNEFYVVGKKFKGIDNNIKTKLLDLISHFDKNVDLFQNSYDISFVKQLDYIFDRLVNQYINNFDRQLYYVDNYKNLSAKDLKEMDRIIKNKNKEWVDKKGIKKINKEDIL